MPIANKPISTAPPTITRRRINAVAMMEKTARA
jgi:hypothetical protein